MHTDTAVATTSWQVVKNLTCEPYVNTSFDCPDTQLLGYGGAHEPSIAAETAGWRMSNNHPRGGCFDTSFFGPDIKHL